MHNKNLTHTYTTWIADMKWGEEMTKLSFYLILPNKHNEDYTTEGKWQNMTMNWQKSEF